MYCLCPQLFMYIWKPMCPPNSSNVLFHFFPFYFASFISLRPSNLLLSVNYGGPQVSRQKKKAHDKRKMLAAKKKQVRAKEKNSRQKKKALSKWGMLMKK